MISFFVPSLASVYAQLTNFANLGNFWSLFDTVFGSSYDLTTAVKFKSQWQNGSFSQFPQIEVVSNSVLGTANGAYAISTNKIYLSDSFISAASQQSLEAVILEEFGHFVDAQVNTKDTAGDEGELFSAIVRGVNLSAAELSRIKTENDHAAIVVNGRETAIEMANGSGVISFSNSQFSVNENGIPVTQVTLTRTGGSTGAVSATIDLSDGTAWVPNDYNNIPITVDFTDGETSKTVTIPITDDNLIETSETINLALVDPTNGAMIGTQNNAILTIVDNDTCTGSLISQNLPIANYTASSIYTEEPIYYEGSETSFDDSWQTHWNSGDVPIQWIEVDLGKEYALNTIQLLIDQLPEGDTTHEIWFSSQPIAWSGNGVLSETIQGFTTAGQWLRDDFSNMTIGRYVQIKTVASPSWVAWQKIEIYGSNIINGTPNDDNLIGTPNNDIIIGLAGNDKLDGKAGSDNLQGGKGNDTYTVDSTGDIVTEDVNEGTDTVRSYITYTLGNNLENLTLLGGSNFNAKGNELNNTLLGNNGNNNLSGGAGNDVLDGGAGNDVLDGGAGNDTAQGGLGNDTYTLSSAGDVVIENANEGTDIVKTYLSYTLGNNLENLTLLGNADINGAGNSLNNNLTGNNFNNTLNGSIGDDTLNGSIGNDTLIGGNGTDTAYYYNAPESVIVNLTTGIANDGEDGIDTLSQIENVQGSNIAGDDLKGDANNNALYGYGGNDTLAGLGGKDTLTGGVGIDTFVFQFGQSLVSNSDRITDFAFGTDRIDLLTQTGLAINAPTNFSRAANSTATTLQNLINSVFTDANGAICDLKHKISFWLTLCFTKPMSILCF
ncbi:discoidin domain-containing protein, partial [Dolichospermum sp. ST_sed3]|nr:discoidin domain-containing protein [Dolichospermum sp. ST_sed3]